MIKIENAEVMGWEAAIRGMRNPMNSWEKSDSKMCNAVLRSREILPGVEETYYDPCEPYISIGKNDISLMQKLANAGPVHGKFRRMITVYVDITAPLYWWKEFDTYKVGTVANSCSTMHKIHEKKFTLEDFSCEHLFEADDIEGMYYSQVAEEEFDATDVLNVVIEALNEYRRNYIRLKTKIKNEGNKNEHLPLLKKYWWQMIQLLPSSYNQRRTVMLNYEVLANIYKYRKDHKLDEWRELRAWIEQLPYSELITGETKGE